MDAFVPSVAGLTSTRCHRRPTAACRRSVGLLLRRCRAIMVDTAIYFVDAAATPCARAHPSPADLGADHLPDCRCSPRFTAGTSPRFPSAADDGRSGWDLNVDRATFGAVARAGPHRRCRLRTVGDLSVDLSCSPMSSTRPAGAALPLHWTCRSMLARPAKSTPRSGHPFQRRCPAPQVVLRGVSDSRPPATCTCMSQPGAPAAQGYQTFHSDVVHPSRRAHHPCDRLH